MSTVCASGGLRRAHELVTARRMLADGLLTEGEFLSSVARVLLEVGTAGLVELLTAQATLSWFVAASLAGDEGAAEALQNVARMVASVEGATR